MTVKQMNPPEVKSAMDADPGAVYIDVRTEMEFAMGHPAGAINIPVAFPDSVTGGMRLNPDFVTVVENLMIPIEYARQGHHDGVVDEAMGILKLMGLATKAHAPSASLTQIEMRKLELARAMAARPRLLVSDEAMAGLSSTEVDDILAILFELNQRGITIIMIEHIMRALMRFSERIAVLDAGEKIAEGAPDEILADKRVEKAYLGE